MKCTRFKSKDDPAIKYGIPNTMAFLKLRKDGCTKHESLTFSMTPRCKVDSTIKKAGPVKCQSLKPIFDDTQLAFAGWFNGQMMQYDCGDDYVTSVSQFIEPKDEISKYEELLKIQETKQKDDIMNKIKRLADFQLELQKKHNYKLGDVKDNTARENFLEKIKKLNDSTLNRIEKQVNFHNIPFRCLVSDIEEEQRKYKEHCKNPQNENLISQFNAFPALINPRKDDIEILESERNDEYYFKVKQQRKMNAEEKEKDKEKIKVIASQIRPSGRGFSKIKRQQTMLDDMILEQQLVVNMMGTNDQLVGDYKKISMQQGSLFVDQYNTAHYAMEGHRRSSISSQGMQSMQSQRSLKNPEEQVKFNKLDNSKQQQSRLGSSKSIKGPQNLLKSSIFVPENELNLQDEQVSQNSQECSFDERLNTYIKKQVIKMNPVDKKLKKINEVGLVHLLGKMEFDKNKILSRCESRQKIADYLPSMFNQVHCKTQEDFFKKQSKGKEEDENNRKFLNSPKFSESQDLPLRTMESSRQLKSSFSMKKTDKKLSESVKISGVQFKAEEDIEATKQMSKTCDAKTFKPKKYAYYNKYATIGQKFKGDSSRLATNNYVSPQELAEQKKLKLQTICAKDRKTRKTSKLFKEDKKIQ